VTELKETERSEDEGYDRWIGMVHATVRVAIGAAALTRDDPEGFVHNLVACGKISQDSGKALIRALVGRAIPDTDLARSLGSVTLDRPGQKAG
jgi:hypothetical protein